ncbi:MAG: radical SAM/SPASM domain-containing protein [Acidimicrobiia bacterium]|nr:radical SAM/SPASM domain-containing protein [Acidimicrobiia bacterium]
MMVNLAAIGFTIDIEITNRCNAKCYFCPREATPHQGLMSPQVYAQALSRAVEFRDAAASSDISKVKVSLCGLGEPLLNRRAPDYVRQATAAGFHTTISSNGGILDEAHGRALLDAGLGEILINAGETGEAYEDVYKLPWERTRENIVRFAEMAGDACDVTIVLVNHRQDPEHLAAMRDYWGQFGIRRFLPFEIMNRGGTLFVDHMQYEGYSERAVAEAAMAGDDGPPRCVAPFVFQFIGYDGNYYLCCSDWEKQVPLGSVYERSLMDIFAEKWAHVSERRSICATCNVDPVNRLTDELRGAAERGEDFDTDGYVEEWTEVDDRIVTVVDQITAAASGRRTAPIGRRLIPVTVD